MSAGDFLIYIAAIAGVLSAALLVKGDEKYAGRSIAAFAAFLTIAFLLLVYYFVFSDFSISYVWSYSSRDLPLFYKLSGVLAGQQGTLLFWGFLVSLFTLWLSKKSEFSASMRKTHVIAIAIALYFVALTALDSPFKKIHEVYELPSDALPEDGAGLNPLLIDPWMAIHPPLMFIAYAAMALPFALAMVYLFESANYKEWIANATAWCRISWLFLTLGIAVGGFWSYKVLGWGGFWAWDPVETSSLVPWLLLTGALHSLAEHRNSKEKYSILAPTLVALSFVLVLYATLVTRSGFFESIHAFGSGEVGTYLVVLIAACCTATLFLAVARYVKSEGGKEEASTLNRTNIFYGAILLFIILTFISFWGITFPAIYRLATGNKVGVGIAFFNIWSYPFIISAMLLLGLGINFKPSEKERQVKEFAAFAALTLIFAFVRPSGAWNIVDYSAIVTPEKPFLYTLIGSMSSLSFIPPSVYMLYSLFERGRGRLKGQRKVKEAGILVVHLGVVLILLGAAFSTLFTEELSVSMDRLDKIFYANNYGAKLLEYREYAEYSKEKKELPPALSLSEFYARNLSQGTYMVRGRLERTADVGGIALLKLAEGDKFLWVAAIAAGIPEGIEIAAAGILTFDAVIENKTYDVIMISNRIYASRRTVSETQEVSVEVYEGKNKIGGGIARVVQYQQGDVKRVMIDRGIFRDVYVIFAGISGGEIPLTVKIIPLVNYLWIGIVLFVLGMLALLSGVEK